jgi:quercetin dioxygenase-like cupin family protein
MVTVDPMTRSTRMNLPSTQVREALSRVLPAMDGQRLQFKMLEVTYAPGAASEPHRHPCPVFGYVVRGAVRMRVADAPELIYRAGDSFYEASDTPHIVSANASQTESATFIAAFLCDHESKLSVPLRSTRDTTHHTP